MGLMRVVLRLVGVVGTVGARVVMGPWDSGVHSCSCGVGRNVLLGVSVVAGQGGRHERVKGALLRMDLRVLDSGLDLLMLRRLLLVKIEVRLRLLLASKHCGRHRSRHLLMNFNE